MTNISGINGTVIENGRTKKNGIGEMEDC